MLKKILQLGLQAVKFLFPKSRIGNVVYLILGYLLSNFDSLNSLVNEIVKIFSGS